MNVTSERSTSAGLPEARQTCRVSSMALRYRMSNSLEGFGSAPATRRAVPIRISSLLSLSRNLRRSCRRALSLCPAKLKRSSRKVTTPPSGFCASPYRAIKARMTAPADVVEVVLVWGLTDPDRTMVNGPGWVSARRPRRRANQLRKGLEIILFGRGSQPRWNRKWLSRKRIFG
jgi:hypothetical protein